MKKWSYILFIRLALLICFSQSNVIYSADSLFLCLTDSVDIIVASDGSGDYTSVQEAIDAVPDGNPEQIIIYVRNGVYKEKILIPASKTKIALIGQSIDSTILTYDDYNGRIVGGDTLGTSDSYSFAVESDDFVAMNLTIKNTAGDVGQAVALRSRGDRQAFLHCRLEGYQDTYYTYGKQRNFLKDCQIIGAIDYIFGSTTVVFDSCQIHSLRNDSYITAASTPEGVGFGYVFFDSRLTAPYSRSGIFLGRPWRPYAQTVFYECEEGSFLSSAGWSIWNGNNNHLTCFYAEYKCFGDGSDTTYRVSWSHQLTNEEAMEYTLENIFADSTSPEFGSDWLPSFEDDFIYSCVKKHTVKFMDSINYNSRVKSILYEGTELEGFSPDSFSYYIELPAGTTEVPALEVVMEYSLSTYQIQYPVSLPNKATIVGTARDMGTHSAYTVYLSVDSAYFNARLKTLRYNGVSVPDFDPDTYNYSVELPMGTISVPNIAAYTEVSQATKVINLPESVPGFVQIIVTAVDGKTTRTYTIDFTVATGLTENNDSFEGFTVSNPFSDEVYVYSYSFIEGEIEFLLYTVQGVLTIKKKFPEGFLQQKELIVDTSALISGSYLYTIVCNGVTQSGKIVKLY
jgi:pectinesterase